ncbi:3-phosphoshikimate 1-carboxyvinyltransferase [Pedobacter endophyticus]|uniref:3-phosphoshikimate 1-carboxyvinyltransferase n=1 Tax=Pedobacter endophyticus TaxID=2789740 RepID=A0A7S9L1X3_9SPHI|nr:3-phosphoshikimate 1-carboxyvinyltransferase [Pedobacter endophyticus]QPH40729.1 3-phosphoshikimate 1-carboxyvinyltransferase [Pedobacter endophyticus]
MSKNALVSFKGTKNINTEIQLTGSKSECNRALIISALSDKLVKVENLSNAADTVTLDGILKKLGVESSELGESATLKAPNSTLVDVGPAGTAMRFLSAYLSAKNGNFLLTGTERMKQRPIGILAEALKTIGANISYAENDGFPPLNIVGPLNQKTSKVKIKGDVSSQYISALLMIAPTLPDGLTLEIDGELTSKPYVDMTLDMLAEAGIKHLWNGNSISISAQPFKSSTLVVEPDWSAASYWYSIAALAHEAEISLPALKEKSLQGDSKIQNIMRIFGISTEKTEKGIAISNLGVSLDTDQILDLKTCPDLAQTIIVVAAALGKNMAFTGLETLKIKETNRIAALQNELAKIGVTLTEDNLVYTLNTDGLHFPDKITIATYEDHRMAMAFAPLALLINEVEIEEMQVVEKSYPYFWEDLKKAGFEVKEI